MVEANLVRLVPADLNRMDAIIRPGSLVRVTDLVKG